MSDETAGRLVLGARLLCAVGLGVLGWRSGRAFRRGEIRDIARGYFDHSLMRGVRNMAFAQTAFGTAFLGAALAMAGMFLPWMAATALCVLIGGAVFAVAGVVGVVRQFRPPERMKPEWLKEQERGQSPEG